LVGVNHYYLFHTFVDPLDKEFCVAGRFYSNFILLA